jgi:hypothetical protein
MLLANAPAQFWFPLTGTIRRRTALPAHRNLKLRCGHARTFALACRDSNTRDYPALCIQGFLTSDELNGNG